MSLSASLRGRLAERRAATYLRRRGLRILQRNVRAGRYEIDLLAREGDVPVLVEVRHRRAGVLAADLSVGREKTRRLQQAWRHLRRARRLPPHPLPRIDLVLVSPDAMVHVRDALPCN